MLFIEAQSQKLRKNSENKVFDNRDGILKVIQPDQIEILSHTEIPDVHVSENPVASIYSDQQPEKSLTNHSACEGIP